MSSPILSFDLTGTLATFSFCDSIYFEGLPHLYSSKHGIEIEEAKGYLIKCYDEVGDQEPDWYDITYWFKRFDLGDGWYPFLEELSYNIRFDPQAEPVLARLATKYELIMVSNACREFLDVETASISKYFTRIISCVSDFGEVKKTPEFYLKLCQSINKKPEEIIHIGDNWQFDFVAPREAGLQAIYLDRTNESSGNNVIHKLSELKNALL
ncbi:MAG: HAD family hydrolase [Dehalococcoidia bacterium]